MKALHIRLSASPDDYHAISRFGNFADDVYREFALTGLAELPDFDTTTTELHIIPAATRHLGTVATFVTKALRRQHLTELTTVTRLDRPKAPTS